MALLDCPICYETFDKEKLLPKILNCVCQQIICQVCLKVLLTSTTVCPFDKSLFRDSIIENYPTSQLILEVLDNNGGDSCDDVSETQKKERNKKRKEQVRKCEKSKKMADQLIHKLRENEEKRLNNMEMSSKEEENHEWALGGLEVTAKKLKVQACFQEDLNNIQREFVEGGSAQLPLRIDYALTSLANELKAFEENYKMVLQNLVFNSSNLLRQKMETVSHLIQIIQREDYIGIMPKEFGTGCTDILREIEVWKNAKKVVIFFKKDRINEDVLQAMAAVFEEFVNVTDVKLDLRNQDMTDNELSLLFERQFWQKPSIRGLSLDMEKSKASSTALTKVLSKITTDMPQLTSLEIWMHGTQISNEGLEAFGKHTLASLYHLRHFGLGVSECEGLSDAGFVPLIPIMANSLRNLTSLTFGFNKNHRLTNDLLILLSHNFLSSLTQLENFHLFLAGTELKDSGLAQISNDLKYRLQNVKNFSLFLNHTKITDLGAQYFIKTVLPNLPQAQTLALSFHQTKIGDATMTALLNTVTGSLKDLKVVSLNLTNTDVSNTAMSQYNCKKFCSMKQIQFFELYTHGPYRTSNALLNFKSRVQKENVENSSKFKFW